MSSRGRKAVAVLVGIVSIGLVAWAYNRSPQLTRSASPDWSQGIPLGVASVKNPVAVATGVTGHTFLVWTDLEQHLHLAQLDQRGQMVQNRPLELPTRWPVQAQLHPGVNGDFCLTWLDGEGGQLRLYQAFLDPLGQVRSSPISLTAADADVESYAVVRNSQGTFDAFWDDEEGIHHRSFDSTGVMGESRLLAAGGSEVVAQLDRQGLIRLVWMRETAPLSARFEVYYATFDPVARQMSPAQPVGVIFRHLRQHATGPFLGLDSTNAYVFWSVEGEDRGQLYYSTFPLDDPGAYRVEEVHLPSTNFITASAAAPGQSSEMVAAWTVEVSSHLIREQQVAEAHFSAGQFRAMQIVSLSKTASLCPIVLRDARRNRHMIWLDAAGFGQYRVMYASTSPSVKEMTDRLNVRSLVDETLDTFISLSLVILFLPLLFLWALVPMTFLVIYSVVTYRVELSERSTRWALAIAILLQVLVSGLIAPGSSMIQWEGLPSVTTTFLVRWGLPVALAVVALGVMFLYWRRAQAPLLLQAFIIFSVTHGLLRLAFFVVTYVRQAFSFDYLYVRH